MNEMNAPSWLADPWVKRLGWTLVQFLWQGVVIAGVFAIVRGTCARSWSSRSRYALACATLALMTLAPVLTFLAGAGEGSASARWLLPGTSGWDSFMPALVAVWLSGVLALSIRLLGGWFAARNLRTRGVRPAPAHWQETFDRLCERLDISQHVRLLISPRIEVPVVVGWLRPVVLVPLGALTGLPPDYVTALLAHELAHVCRRDYLVNLLQHVAEAMLFYHPATWWVSAQIRIEREMSCDDIAVAVQGDPLVYARALTELDTSRRAWRTLEVAANGPSLLHRIRRLLGHTVSPWQLLPGPGALVAIILLWLVGVAAVAARTERPIAVAERAPAPAGVETADSRGASGLLATALLGPIGPPRTAQPSRPLATGSGRAVAVDSDGPSPRDDMDQTSTIRGRVTSAATGLPLRNATVQLLPSSPSADEGFNAPFSALTDDDGRYELSGVTPGKYNVNAQKPGFLAGLFGRRSSLTPRGKPLEATGGRAHDQIDMALPAGGVITGVVLDAAGDPLAGVVVGARRSEFFSDVPRPTWDDAWDVTDDLGRYRLFGLERDTYFLVALLRNPTSSGDGYHPISSGAGYLSPASPVIFYPGTSRSTEARLVRVETGRELTAPPFTVVPARAAKVSGSVARQDGKPLGHVTVSLRMRGIPHPQTTDVIGGAFVFPRVATGEYTLVARSDEDGVALATSPLVIDGSDLTVPPLVLRRTSTLRGRVTLDVDASTVSAPQASIVVWDGNAFAQIPVRDDWSFEFTGLSGRTRRFDVNLPAGWALQSIRAGDQDLMEAPLEFDGRDIDDVEVRLTQRGTVISGRVSGLQRDSDSGWGFVLIFPEDPERLRALGSSRIKLEPIDESGRYRAEGLVPGKYLAVALESFERSDPSALERFAPVATAFTIAEGEQRALDLRLVFR